MRIIGRRFWTWTSVWVFSFLAGRELTSAAQEKPATSGSSTVVGEKRDSRSQTIGKREHKTALKTQAGGSPVRPMVGTGMSKSTLKSQSGGTATSKIAPMDAASKDAAKTTTGTARPMLKRVHHKKP